MDPFFPTSNALGEKPFGPLASQATALTTRPCRLGLVIDITFEVPRVDESLLVDYKIAINVVAQLEGSK